MTKFSASKFPYIPLEATSVFVRSIRMHLPFWIIMYSSERSVFTLVIEVICGVKKSLKISGWNPTIGALCRDLVKS